MQMSALVISEMPNFGGWVLAVQMSALVTSEMPNFGGWVLAVHIPHFIQPMLSHVLFI